MRLIHADDAKQTAQTMRETSIAHEKDQILNACFDMIKQKSNESKFSVEMHNLDKFNHASVHEVVKVLRKFGYNVRKHYDLMTIKW